MNVLLISCLALATQASPVQPDAIKQDLTFEWVNITAPDLSKVDFSHSLTYAPTPNRSLTHPSVFLPGVDPIDVVKYNKETPLQDYWFVDGPYYDDRTWWGCHECAGTDHLEMNTKACQSWEAHVDMEIVAKIEEVTMTWKAGYKWGEEQCKGFNYGCDKHPDKATVCIRSTVPIQRVYGWVKQHIKVERCEQGFFSETCQYKETKESDSIWIDYDRPTPGKFVDFWCDARNDRVCISTLFKKPNIFHYEGCINRPI